MLFNSLQNSKIDNIHILLYTLLLVQILKSKTLYLTSKPLSCILELLVKQFCIKVTCSRWQWRKCRQNQVYCCNTFWYWFCFVTLNLWAWFRTGHAFKVSMYTLICHLTSSTLRYSFLYSIFTSQKCPFSTCNTQSIENVAQYLF